MTQSKVTSRASSLIKAPRPSPDKQKVLKAELQVAKEIENRLKAERAEARQKRNEKRRIKTERKKENAVRNAVKHQGAQFIKDTKKIKKWDAKARSQLVKMSPEFIAQRYGTK